uniref:Uncharacterized protein n=1 Tax=Corethron hystrix TaxID=216773 RepID=A0A7S1BX31_9STRA
MSEADAYVTVHQHRRHSNGRVEAAAAPSPLSQSSQSSPSSPSSPSSEKEHFFSKKYLEENADKIHKTERIDDENDPIWTVLTGSLFLMKIPEDDLTIPVSNRPALTFVVTDFNMLTADKLIGMATLTVREMAAALEQEDDGTHRRISVPLFQEHTKSGPKGKPSPKTMSSLRKMSSMKRLSPRRNLLAPPPGPKVQGHLSLRFRRATLEDEEFVRGRGEVARDANKRVPFLDVDFNESYGVALTGPRGDGAKELLCKSKWKSKRSVLLDNAGVKKLRVQPYPDPRDPAGTEWMTKPELEEKVQLPSTRWLECGSGDLGRIHVSTHILLTMRRSVESIFMYCARTYYVSSRYCGAPVCPIWTRTCSTKTTKRTPSCAPSWRTRWSRRRWCTTP